ncbi:MAG: Slp family lipoprotein [Nitrospira sp.]|nr:Slp family lipoprotein [Nitrospira sp.]
MMSIFLALSPTVVFGVLEQGRRFAMRMIGLFAMCVLLEACTIIPMFPPEVMKNVETNTFDLEAWQQQTYHPSNDDFVSHKVELGGEIIEVVRKPEGVVLLVEAQPIENHTTYGTKSVERGDSFWYAVAFNGSPESSMLQRGNKLVVVGMTERASTEIIGGAPRVLPHLLAQCLHIWNTREAEAADFSYYGGPMGHHPAEEQTFCLRDDGGKSLPISESRGDKQQTHSEGL